MADDEDDGLDGQRMIAWLKQRGPDDWHFVGSNLNWDTSMEVIQWILDQKDCDKATAAMMFWLSSPDYFLAFPNREALAADRYASVNIGNFDFTRKLVDRWNSGFYTRSNIAYAPLSHVVENYRRTEAQYAANGLPWTVGDDIGAVRRGVDVLSDAEYRKRYSDELARLLYALSTMIPHPDSVPGQPPDTPPQGDITGRLKRMFGLD
jgi:hypothetical protein